MMEHMMLPECGCLMPRVLLSSTRRYSCSAPWHTGQRKSQYRRGRPARENSNKPNSGEEADQISLSPSPRQPPLPCTGTYGLRSLYPPSDIPIPSLPSEESHAICPTSISQIADERPGGWIPPRSNITIHRAKTNKVHDSRNAKRRSQDVTTRN
jgi:hypothetical protein